MAIERAFASANDTLDSTSDTLINSMTLTPASGQYLLVFSCNFLTASASGTDFNTFSVYVGGTQIPHTEREYHEDTSVDNCFLPMAIACEVNPNGSQAVEIRHRASGTASPIVAQRRELLLLPVTDAILEDSSTANDTLATATWTTVDGMTRTPPAGDYLLVFTTSGDGPSGTQLGFRASVGGTPIAASEVRNEQESSAAADEMPIMVIASISPNGSQVVEIEWSRVVGSGTITIHEHTMVLIPTAAADIFEVTGTANDSDGTTTDKLIDGMTITDPGAGDYLVLFAATDFFGSVANNKGEVTYSVRVGGSKVADSVRMHEHEGSIDNADLTVMVGARVTLVAGDDIQMYWQGSSTTSRTIYDRTLIAIREAVAGGQTIAVNQVTETDAPQAMGRLKTLAAAQITETDLAQSLGRLKTLAAAQILETDLAQTLSGSLKTLGISQITESDLAQSVSWAPKNRLVNLVSETDLSQVVSRLKTALIAQATENDISQVVSWSPKNRLVNLASDTELAQALSILKTLAVAQIAETDLAQSVSWSPKNRLVNLISESDLAQIVSWAPKNRLVNLVVETSLAQAMSWAPKNRLVGQIVESDLAQTLGRLKTLVALRAIETDLAQTVARLKTLGILQTTESDIAQTVAWAPKNRLIGLVIETDLAQPISTALVVLVAQATESDLSQTIAWAPKNRLVNQITESDLSQAVGRLKTLAVSQVTETDLAQTISRLKTLGVTQVTESDLAQLVAWAPKSRLVEQILEANLAQAISWAPKNRLVAQISESDIAQAIGRLKTLAALRATEADLAQTILRLKTLGILQITESDVAQAVAWSPKNRLVAQIAEADLAQGVAWAPKNRLVGLVTETELAQVMGRLKTLGILQVTETDLAQMISLPGGVTVLLGQASESDIAQLLSILKTMGIGLASESDIAWEFYQIKTYQEGKEYVDQYGGTMKMRGKKIFNIGGRGSLRIG